MGLLSDAYARILLALSDRQAVTLDFLLCHRRLPDLGPPRTFNEKVLYRKLFEHDPRFPKLADKVLVKDHVAAMLGDDWIIPTLWTGKVLPELEARNWPLPYVVKANHGCGWNLFVRTARDQDWDRIERVTSRWMNQAHGKPLREWLYLEIEPRILVEPYVGGQSGVLPIDYKFFVFGGKAHYIQVDTGRGLHHRQSFYDTNWVRQPFHRRYSPNPDLLPRPQSLDRMFRAAERLAAGFSFLRADFYEINGQPRFGELTFYPGAGRLRFMPRSFDRTFGDRWPTEGSLSSSATRASDFTIPPPVPPG
jgi:hypothetical protein